MSLGLPESVRRLILALCMKFCSMMEAERMLLLCIALDEGAEDPDLLF